MNFWEIITSNSIINATMVSWFVAQVLKVIIILIQKRKMDFSRFFGAGGMPSSHTSTTAALVTMVARVEGFDSVFFAISFIFMLVVMYDATGVRRAAGKQAAVLNKMMDNWDNDDPHFWDEKMKELIGHTPFQVFVGCILGVVIGMIMPI